MDVPRQGPYYYTNPADGEDGVRAAVEQAGGNGGVVVLSEGTYDATDGAVSLPSNVSIVGAGAGVSEIAFELRAIGSIGSSAMALAAESIGTTPSVRVESGTTGAVSPGDWVRVIDSKGALENSSDAKRAVAELVRVASVDTDASSEWDRLHFDQPLHHDYRIVDGGPVARVEPVEELVENVHLRGFSGPWVQLGTNRNVRIAECEIVSIDNRRSEIPTEPLRNVTIENVECAHESGGGSSMVNLLGLVDGELRNLTFRNGQKDHLRLAGGAVNVDVVGCASYRPSNRPFRIYRGIDIDVRSWKQFDHAVDQDAWGNFEQVLVDYCRDVTIEDSFFYSGKGRDGIEQRATTDDLTIRNNKFVYDDTYDHSFTVINLHAFEGTQDRGPGVLIENNVCRYEGSSDRTIKFVEYQDPCENVTIRGNDLVRGPEANQGPFLKLRPNPHDGDETPATYETNMIVEDNYADRGNGAAIAIRPREGARLAEITVANNVLEGESDGSDLNLKGVERVTVAENKFLSEGPADERIHVTDSTDVEYRDNVWSRDRTGKPDLG
jgi:hypothetical protein